MALGVLTDEHLAERSATFESADAADVVRWAVDTFGDGLVLTASMADAVLVDVASRVRPGIEVLFLDTQYHFPETLATLDAVRARYDCTVRVLRPERPRDDLWKTDPDACCRARKVEPLDAALAGRSAWMSGVRRADSPDRVHVPIVARDRRGLVKVNPLANWTDADVERYVAEHDVVVNPLLSQGFPSIGCWPCTSRVRLGEDVRSGRWAGTGKTECGLHT